LITISRKHQSPATPAIRTGELWDEVIKANIERAQIALVLVSQGFLDSEYCQNVEIKNFLAHKAHLFPIILSPCEWQRHSWLSNRQFLPGGDQTIEEHYIDPGKRKRLYLEIRSQLRAQVQRVRQVRTTLASAPLTSTTSSSSDLAKSTAGRVYSGRDKVVFCQRLGDDWRKLADYLEIAEYDQARFERGDEGRGIWVWLENRRRLEMLPESLRYIGREDLAELLTGA
jgi:hypothetical protein